MASNFDNQDLIVPWINTKKSSMMLVDDHFKQTEFQLIAQNDEIVSEGSESEGEESEEITDSNN